MKLAATHQNADLDGIASLVALSLLYEGLTLGVPSGMEPETYRFVSEHQSELPPILGEAELKRRFKGESKELLFLADTSTPGRIGWIKNHLQEFTQVLAWDTHPFSPEDVPRATLPHASACISALIPKLVE